MSLEIILWNGILSVFTAIISFSIRSFMMEQKRLQILLNRTREEIAKEYVTKAEVHADINRVLDRLDRLDSKLDRLVEIKNAQ